MSKHKLMPKVMLKLFFKIQAWARGAHFEWLIGNSLRYLIPFHLIKKNQKTELFCHLKSENIFQQLNKSSFLKSLMTDNQDTFNILPDQNCANIFYCSPGITSRRWFLPFCLVLIGEYGTKPTADVYSTCAFLKTSLCSPASLRFRSLCVWEETMCRAVRLWKMQ